MAELRLGQEIISTARSCYSKMTVIQDTTPESLGDHRRNLADL